MKKKILVIDNYDSFTYNLVQMIEQINGIKPDVYKNDKIDIEKAMDYEYIFISPGPGLPEESGITLDLINAFYTSKKIFGVCLGLQAIVVAMGGQLKNLKKVYHGIETDIHRCPVQSPIFEGIGEIFKAGRYHSWVADETILPDSLEVTCTGEGHEIMAIQHRDYPVYGVQFHPESIMTPDGYKMLENFLNLNEFDGSYAFNFRNNNVKSLGDIKAGSEEEQRRVN